MQFRLKLALELERLRRKNLQKIHPLHQLFWESTLRCNANCRHCGSDCRSTDLTPDMPSEDFLRVLDSITPHVDPHKVFVIISGGEPTMRKDLEAVGKEIKQRGYPWGMVTNGIALTDTRYKALRKAGMVSMSVSLDGFETDHDWMRGHKGSFLAATHAISLAAADQQLVFDVITCANRRTIHYLPELRDYLWGLGVRHWRIGAIIPMGRAKNDPELLISDEEYRTLLNFIKAEHIAGRHVSYGCEGFLGDYEGQVRNGLFHCSAGISTASVLIDGSISACTSIRGKYYQGNIYKDDFWTVWENGFAPYRNRNWMRKIEPCNTCEFFRYCEGNGMHLRREDGSLMVCQLHRLQSKQS